MSLPRIAVRGVWCVLALVLSGSAAGAQSQTQDAYPSRVGPPARISSDRPTVVARRVRPAPFVRVAPIVPLRRGFHYRPYFPGPHFGVGVYFGAPYWHRPYRRGYGYLYPYGYSYYPAPPYDRRAGSFYGGVRFDVRQRDAAVYVDGYYAGIVDDFDGAFQHLALEPGPHRIELRLPGYETLAFDVNVRPDETIRYHGDLEPLRP